MTAQTAAHDRATPPKPPPSPAHVSRQDRDAAVKAEQKLAKTNQIVNRSLITLGGGALAFTCINVTLFAVDHGIPVWVAWLLDPLASLALITTLYVDGVLAEQGDYRASGWPLILRWTAGLSTWLMNCWTSLYPDGDVTLVPQHPDPGGLLLHSVAPVLLITLAEGASGYRGKISERLTTHRATIAEYDAAQHRERERKENEARAEREREAREEREEREREAREKREAAQRETEREAAERKRRAEIEAKREAAEIDRANREHEARLKAEEKERAAQLEERRLKAQAEAAAIEEAARAEAEVLRQREEAERREKEEKRRAALARRASQSAARPASESAGAASQNGRRHASNSDGDSSENASENGERVPRTVREEQRRAAEKWVAECLANGTEPTAADVGDRYGKGETWGGDRIRAVKSRTAPLAS